MDQPDAAAKIFSGTVNDPVCGMSVDPSTAKQTLIHAGLYVYFCGAKCREKFAADPAAFLTPQS